MTEAIIDLKDIAVTFDDGHQVVHAVQDVNLQIQTGDIYGLSLIHI